MLFAPLLIPTWGMVAASTLSVLAILPLKVLATATAVVCGLTALIPTATIGAMYRMGTIKDPGLTERRERTIPYIIAGICYCVCSWWLSHAGAPAWLSRFILGGAAAIAVIAVVNLRWKISAHAAGVAGLVAMFMRLATAHQCVHDLNWWITGSIIIAGAVMSTRVYMQRHTLLQVLAGAAVGYSSVWLTTAF